MRAWSSSRVPRSTWLGRLVRGWRPDRNPLRRTSDRAELAVLGALLTAFLAGAPFAAHAAGSWTYAISAREAHLQQTTLHQVRATLLTGSAPWSATAYGAEANARWTAPDGQVRTGPVLLPNGATAGSTVMVWTDQSGQLTDPPLQATQIVSRVDLSRVLAVAALAILLIAVGALVHRRLNKRRLAGWDRDWQATGPRWSRQRLDRANGDRGPLSG